MAKRGRPTVEIILTPAEQRQLESWTRRHSSAQALALRCRIVLACADPTLSRQQIADRVGCNPATVTKWRNRFARDRLDGLIDEPRPGAARSIDDDMIEQVVVDTLESAPADATHWSTRSLAAKHGISHQTVAEIWRAFGLKPWRQDEFKVSPDPQLVEKIRDLVGLYMNPPVNAAVFAVDEKPPDPGPQPHRSDTPDAALHPSTRDPRLPTQWHHRLVRRARHRHRQSHHQTPAEP